MSENSKIPTPDGKSRVLVVDDHKLFLDGIVNLLSDADEYEIVAEALNGKEALDILEKDQIDLVVTDINMPEISGTELTQRIKQDHPEIKVLVLSMYNDREIIHEIIMSEAEGYVLKNADKTELRHAVSHISKGGTYYSNEVMSIIAENYVSREKIQDKTKNLSQRELEILKLVCQEMSTIEIADHLHISPLTVETHRKNILKKTQARTIVGLIKFAIENGIA